MSEKRTPAGTFVKGVSGNPSGRSKELPSKIRELYKDDVAKIVEVFRDLALGVNPAGYREEIKTSDRIKAGAEVLDRVLGKAPQSIDATVTDVTESQRRMLEALAMTPHQRRQALAAQDSTASTSTDDADEDDSADSAIDELLDD